MRTTIIFIPSFLFLIFILFLPSLSCSRSNTPQGVDGEAFTFDSQPEENFVEFTVSDQVENASIEWTFPGDQKIYGKRKLVYYFEEEGKYDVSLTYTLNGKTYTSTKEVTIAVNSSYFERDEFLWWNDEFDDNEINKTCWNYDIGSNKTQNRWGNNEWQDYTNNVENSFIRESRLVIRAIRSGVGQKVADYTSARLTTKGKKEMNRGRVEVKAKLGGGRGLWPAIWLYQSSGDDKLYSELDIMEYVGVDKDIIYSAVHTNTTLSSPEKTVGANRKMSGVENDFHVYGLNWTDDKVEFYIDDPEKPHLTFIPEDRSNPNDWPFDKSLYLILNIAVGGDWGGMKGVDDTIFPQEMEVEYVRIFKKRE